MSTSVRPLSWQEAERVRELQIWLDCVARCRECGELMPMADFDDQMNVCHPCFRGHHKGAIQYRRQKQLRAA